MEISQTKAQHKQVIVGSITLDAYLLPNGEYRLSESSTNKALGYGNSWASLVLSGKKDRTLKTLQGMGLGDFNTESIEVSNNKPINSVTISQFMILLKYAALHGKVEAINLYDALAYETLERRVDRTFGKVVTEEKRDELLKERTLVQLKTKYHWRQWIECSGYTPFEKRLMIDLLSTDNTYYNTLPYDMSSEEVNKALDKLYEQTNTSQLLAE